MESRKTSNILQDDVFQKVYKETRQKDKVAHKKKNTAKLLLPMMERVTCVLVDMMLDDGIIFRIFQILLSRIYSKWIGGEKINLHI